MNCILFRFLPYPTSGAIILTIFLIGSAIRSTASDFTLEDGLLKAEVTLAGGKLELFRNGVPYLNMVGMDILRLPHTRSYYEVQGGNFQGVTNGTDTVHIEGGQIHKKVTIYPNGHTSHFRIEGWVKNDVPISMRPMLRFHIDPDEDRNHSNPLDTVYRIGNGGWKYAVPNNRAKDKIRMSRTVWKRGAISLSFSKCFEIANLNTRRGIRFTFDPMRFDRLCLDYDPDAEIFLPAFFGKVPPPHPVAESPHYEFDVALLEDLECHPGAQGLARDGEAALHLEETAFWFGGAFYHGMGESGRWALIRDRRAGDGFAAKSVNGGHIFTWPPEREYRDGIRAINPPEIEAFEENTDYQATIYYRGRFFGDRDASALTINAFDNYSYHLLIRKLNSRHLMMWYC